jgi:hypothetical protein
MKKPSIIAHSAAQGFPEKLSPATRLVAVLMSRTSFRLLASVPQDPARIIHGALPFAIFGRNAEGTKNEPPTGLCEDSARHVFCWTRVSLKGRHPQERHERAP